MRRLLVALTVVAAASGCGITFGNDPGTPQVWHQLSDDAEPMPTEPDPFTECMATQELGADAIDAAIATCTSVQDEA